LSLGLSAQVEHKVEGARGKHKLDIFVTGKVHGLDIRWVVECKCWSTNVPKEKALTLLSIVQDIGADKGILLSEVGFQSGAIKVVKETNVMLTSLADLRQNIKESFAESIFANLHWRITKLSHRLHELHRLEKDRYFFTRPIAEKSKLMFLEFAFKDALRGQYPVVYAIGEKDARFLAEDFDDLVKKSSELVLAAENLRMNIALKLT
jgi:hypothetical protein